MLRYVLIYLVCNMIYMGDVSNLFNKTWNVLSHFIFNKRKQVFKSSGVQEAWGWTLQN